MPKNIYEQSKDFLRSILAVPAIYRLWGKIAGRSTSRAKFVEEYIRLKENDKRVLDIACGTADILEYLPGVDYTGFDMSQSYINAAIRRYKNRGFFFAKRSQKML